ncbi:hypothetical protein [Paenibacillus koleovorans]|uniref:hypothetical protein n=1 Tax=Paenibacillus koleovorans TaxID=121608 RepID=UPI000FD845D0|nr:hypothetical protein [Paenibacillus koleovorans]
MRMAKLGVVFDKKEAEARRSSGVNVFESYIGELLGKAGIPFEWIDGAAELTVVKPDLAIVAFVREGNASAEHLWSYVENGGTIVGLGNLGGLAKKLQCTLASPIQPGYAQLPDGYESRPMRFVKAAPWRVTEGNEYLIEKKGSVGEKPQPLLRPDSRTYDALLRFRVGLGTIERWSIDMTATIVGLQQGLQPVFEDGVPAEDGSVPLDDGWLKADDEHALDWVLDRAWTETGQPYFPHAYADLWRETLTSHLLRIALGKGLTLPFLGYWPEGISRVAMISHDSDHNEDAAGEATLALLKECGVQSTWCMIQPGYSAHLYDSIRADGHELGFHYNAIDFEWSESNFDSQFAWLEAAIGSGQAVSNKNHYTRLEGWGELFRWCEKHGIESDQTRGPSKRGNVGMPFGTCHPYFPIAWNDEQNRVYNVLEVGFFTQDMNLSSWADDSIIEPMLSQAEKVDGVAHFLFHQYHVLRKEEVRAAFRHVVKEAHARGFVFWTGSELNAWERARRQVKIESCGSGEAVLSGTEQAKGIQVWLPVTADEATSTEGIAVKFGVPCRKAELAIGTPA